MILKTIAINVYSHCLLALMALDVLNPFYRHNNALVNVGYSINMCKCISTYIYIRAGYFCVKREPKRYHIFGNNQSVAQKTSKD